MADNYLERKMEEYRARPAAAPRPAGSLLDRLLLKNRSHRGFDASFTVRDDQLRQIIAVNTRIPSARNRQVLRFRPVEAGEAAQLLPHIRMGAGLPELHLPLPGTEPNAFIAVCSTVPHDRWVDIDLGISLQSMLLKAVELGLNGLCIGAFDAARVAEMLGLPSEPLMLLALGRGIERIRLVETEAGRPLDYYREEGVHCVPKLRTDDLILPAPTR